MKTKKYHILRIMNVYNEEDIIYENLKYYIDKGFKTLIIDNFSTDDTYKICNRFIKNGVVKIRRIKTDFFDRKLLFKALIRLASEYNPDYLLLADADEFYESPVKGEDLYTALEKEFNKGYNVIQFHNIEFWMTKKDPKNEKSVLKRMKYYSYFDSNRFKAFKFIEGADLVKGNGHYPNYPPSFKVKISPKVFISRHYKFRSLNQAYNKIERIKPPLYDKTIGFHYLKLKKDPSFFIIDEKLLTKYTEDSNWCFVRKFDGNRMTLKELADYLGFDSEEKAKRWIRSRDYREVLKGLK